MRGNAGHALIVPVANGDEVALSGHAAAYGAASLREAAARLSGTRRVRHCARVRSTAQRGASIDRAPPRLPAVLSDVAGQWQAKRALIIAAAGGHSLLMVGPPGSGKSMLAARLPVLLPPLSPAEALEVAGDRLRVRLAARCPAAGCVVRFAPRITPLRRMRSSAAVPRSLPGEISLAHQGVLFLDELPEFDRRVLESLREPLETGAHHRGPGADRV